MELKVWVEGIQRVVCGANYSTTCQDVVLALAHAMGRTGRFTLVERWRDSERPLTPAECPLQALHKWGEYAAEVRFFLIQADGNPANTSSNSIGSGSSRGSKDGERTAGTKGLPAYPKSQLIGGYDGNSNRPNDAKLRHGTSFPSSPSPSPRGGFSSGSKAAPQKPYHNQLQHLQQSDNLKRSSTFSGAHNYALQAPPPTSSSSYSNNIPLPSSTSSHPSYPQYNNAPYHPQQQNLENQPLPSSSSSSRARLLSNPAKQNNQTGYGNQPVPQKTRRPSQGQQSGLVPPLTNGVDYNRSGISSSSSSPRSPSGLSTSQGYSAPSAHHQAQNSSSNNSGPHHPHERSDPRMGDQRDNTPNDSREFHPANPVYGRPSSSSHGPGSKGIPSSGAPTRPRENTSQHQPDTRHRHPRRERRPRSPTPHRSGTAGPQQHSQNHPSVLQSKQNQQLPPSHNQHLPAYSFHHTAPQRHDQQTISSHSSENFPPSASPVPPIPAPRQRSRPSPEPVEYENLPSSRGRNLQRSHHQPQNAYQQPQEYQHPQKPPSPRRRDRSQSRDRRRDEAGELTRNNAQADSRGLGAPWSVPAPQTSGGPPVWSQAGRVGDTNRQHSHTQNFISNERQQQQSQQQQLSKSLPASGMNLLRRSNESGRPGIGNSVDFVESVTKRQHQNSNNTLVHPGRDVADTGDSRGTLKHSSDLSARGMGGGRSMSSFASAVANIRQHSRERTPRSNGFDVEDQPSSWQSGDQLSKGLGEDSANSANFNLDYHTGTSSFSNDVQSQQKWNSSHDRQFTPSKQDPQHNLPKQQNIPSDNQRSYPRNIYQKSPVSREPTSPPSLTLSPRHNSAFKEVSPRHSHQLSPSSPPAAFSFDQNTTFPGGQHLMQETTLTRDNRDIEALNHAQADSGPDRHPHFRQLSLEVEEYDLDQNFPDLSHRDRDSGAGAQVPARETALRSNVGSSSGPAGPMESTPLEYRLDNGGVRPAPHRAEAEYLQLARLVNVQLDRIKVIEAQIADASTEISTLEEEASHTDLQLQELSVDGAELEATEEELSKEETELQRVEWENVLDGERKREVDIRQQVNRFQEKTKQAEDRLNHLKSEEEEKVKDITLEKERLAAEESEKIQMEKELSEKVSVVKLELEQVEFTLGSQKTEIDKLEVELAEMENKRKEQEGELMEVEAELKEENLKDFHAHPVAKEPPPGVTTVEDFVFPTSGYKKAKPYMSISSDTMDEDTEESAPETGEAIIKILEGRLSPSSPLAEELNKMAAITSAQQTYKSALAAKNPNGVWV